jgi:hypothetical protein
MRKVINLDQISRFLLGENLLASVKEMDCYLVFDASGDYEICVEYYAENDCTALKFDKNFVEEVLLLKEQVNVLSIEGFGKKESLCDGSVKFDGGFFVLSYENIA